MYEIRTLFTWLYIILSKFTIINQNNVPLEVIVDVFERIASKCFNFQKRPQLVLWEPLISGHYNIEKC